MSAPRTEYAWGRFLLPRGETARLDDGLLVDSGGRHGGLYNPSVVSVESVSVVPCIAVLGEPGIGKTAVLKDLRQLSEQRRGPQQDTMSIDLNAYSSDILLYRSLFESPVFLGWLSGATTLDLFLDGLDESLVHIRTIATLLAQELGKCPASRLRLRIGCRTAEWPNILRDRLHTSWGGGYKEYEVAPLRRADVELAASRTVSNPVLFMDEIRRRSLGPLAARPLTLRFLLESFGKEGRLPERLADLYEQGCRLLCSEISGTRSSSGVSTGVPPERLVCLAERIAAVTMFCKRTRIVLDEQAGFLRGDDEIAMADLLGTDHTGSRPFDVTREELLAAVRTGLFRSAGDPSRLTWGHWSYAEFLAARYMHSRGLSTQQQLELIAQTSVSGSIRITPQLQETAAWLAAMNPELIDVIVRHDPQVLLRSEMDPSVRPALTASLLAMFDREELSDFDLDLRSRYGLLRHPGIEFQLRPYVNDRTKGFLVRRVAIDIAESTEAVALLPDLVAVAIDGTQPVEVRIQAAYAVNRLGIRQYKQQLRPLLNEPTAPDPHLELVGNALRALWPDDMSAEELFGIIQPPPERFGGAHVMFMSHYLMKGLTPADLPVALRWAASQRSDHEITFDFDRLVDAILERAWQCLDEPGVLDSFAETVIARLERYDHTPSQRAQRDAETAVDWMNPEKRHMVLRAVASRMGTRLEHPAAVLAFDTQLVVPEDLRWLLQQLESASSSADENLWAGLVGVVFRSVSDPDDQSVVLRAGARNAALAREIAPLVGPIALDSAEADALRERHRRTRERDEERRRDVTHPPLPAIVDTWLRRYEGGDISAWWRLTLDMTLTDESDRYPLQVELNPDLTDLPAWEQLDEATRKRCVDAAELYVSKGEPDTQEWIGTNTFHRPAMAGYKAIRLLLSNRRSAFDRLTNEDWKKWAPSVVAYPESPDVEARNLASAALCRAVVEAPDEVIGALKSLLDKDAQQGHAYILHRFDDCWNDRLAEAVLDHVRSKDQVPPGALETILECLLKSDLDSAREYALDLIANSGSDGEAGKQRRVTAGSALLKADTKRAWGVLWPMVEHEVEFGRALWLHFATHAESHYGDFVQELAEAELADLYVWLCREFPHQEDPETNGFVGDRHNVASFRDALLEGLKQRGTAASVSALRTLAMLLPAVRWLKFVVLEARRVQLQHDWEAVSPSELFTLASDRRRRLIFGGDQLLGVIVESLRTLDAKLQGETATAFALWDEIVRRPKPEGRTSDYVKTHLDDSLRGSAVVVNREVEIKKGNETDIHVDAVRQLADGTTDVIKVIVEVKGCWHPDVKTAMKEQLVDRYLTGTGNAYGLYLVGWFLCDAWDAADRRKSQTPKWDIDQARTEFANQAATLSKGGLDVRAYVLDARLQ